ncbi:hypothetical protein JTE90_002171 [Oedothorax gibbosus]|uniref:Elongation of very long chain fatty acids protein n=1 Tax=Oedothorax gibbosus TaxID=931172 RepID=A0AAV6V7V6_9ARAC|nr:hypothetical protein JTE90_002171 [Oedothorax gibbosus]
MEGIHDFLGPRDPKMTKYLLMESPTKPILLSALYLLIVLYAGPEFMKHRKPFELRVPMFIYNMFLVGLNGFLFIRSIVVAWSWYDWRCQPIDLSHSDHAVKMTHISWIFYMSKIIEYCDTIFFILRKKGSQINFLHVFHHSTVPITTWFGITYGPGGYNTAFPSANAFVHIWMYLYYGLASLGPGIQKYLWWKKYLTKLQLAQFVFVFVYFLQLSLFPKEGCNVTPFLKALTLGQAVLYFFLFMHFYLRSYGGRPKKSDLKSEGPQQQNGHSKNGAVNKKMK